MNPKQEINSIPIGTPDEAVKHIANILNRLSLEVTLCVSTFNQCLTDYADKEINELVFGVRLKSCVVSLLEYNEGINALYRAFSEEARRRDEEDA